MLQAITCLISVNTRELFTYLRMEFNFFCVIWSLYYLPPPDSGTQVREWVVEWELGEEKVHLPRMIHVLCVYTHTYMHTNTFRPADTRDWHSSCERGHQLWKTSETYLHRIGCSRSLRSFGSPGARNQPHHTRRPLQSIHNREITEHWDQTGRRVCVWWNARKGRNSRPPPTRPKKYMFLSFPLIPTASLCLFLIIIITSVEFYCLFNLIIIALWTSSWSSAVCLTFILFFVVSGHELC